MLFNSYAFVLAFLPAAVAGYFLVARRSHLGANAFLAAASLVFYAWWRVELVALLLASAAVNFAVGRRLSRAAAAGRDARAMLFLGVAFDLGLLGYFKYADFFIANWNTLSGAHLPLLEVALPLGISFFTFTQVAYLVDAWKGKAAEYSPVNYLLFVTYFPHLLAGPIIHHREMMPQFADPRLKRLDWENVARGLVLFTLGLAKKVLVADTLAPWADAGFASAHALTLADGWITMLAYAMQLVYDFSGYTDMALGAALMANIRLPINFDSPYRSADIREFWRRWHITLSRFLRDYVYIPLGGNRRGEARMLAAFLVTFTLGGLWHGAAWTFVAWGAIHGTALVVVHFWRKLGRPLPRPVAIGVTALFVAAAFVVFRAPTLADAGSVLASVAGLNGFDLHLAVAQWAGLARPASIGERAPELGTLAVLAAALAIAFMPRTSTELAATVSLRGWPRYAFGGLLACGLVFIENASPFIYFIF
ncbi:MAG TPA: MBOAT family protein [Usitatibacter sp.]|nr:MBOAT family protein [Usitatibacter sp.]